MRGLQPFMVKKLATNRRFAILLLAYVLILLLTLMWLDGRLNLRCFLISEAPLHEPSALAFNSVDSLEDGLWQT